jgi:hypothetical protein
MCANIIQNGNDERRVEEHVLHEYCVQGRVNGESDRAGNSIDSIERDRDKRKIFNDMAIKEEDSNSDVASRRKNIELYMNQKPLFYFS